MPGNKMTALDTQLTEKVPRNLAGGTIYARGLDYFRGGTVTDLRLINNKLRAVVSGSDDYDVRLWADAQGLDYECSCPMGQEGECCKHVVAAGLAWLAQHGGKNTAGAEMRHDTDHLRGYLLAKSKETLAGWLLQQCEEDPALHDQLKLRAARGKQTLDIKQLKEAVTSNLPQRILEHKHDMVEGFTKQYGVHTLVYYELHSDMSEAITREKRIKKWNRVWKLRLIEQRNPNWADLWNGII